MDAAQSTYSEIDEILEQQRRRSEELDVETAAAEAELRAEIDERQRLLDEQRAEAERVEAERREAEEAERRERARREHISIGENADEDPFAGRTQPTWSAPAASRGAPESSAAPAPEPPQQPAAANDPRWQVKAGRFGRRDEPEEQPAAESTPPPKPAPRRRRPVQDDWDDDFSQRSWLQ